MTNFEYDGYDADLEVGGTAVGAGHLFRMVNWLGGVTSLALIAGLGYWGYNLMMRDVTGVPVVRALQGPFREAPDDPGGTLAQHQGLSVNEVTKTGTAGQLPDAIVLAPDAMDLAEEDLPVADLPKIIPAVADGTDAAAAVGVASVVIEDLPEDALATDMAVAEALSNIADPMALADALTDGVEPLTALDRETDAQGGPDHLATTPQASPGALAGLISSPRPPVRPSGLTRGVKLASATDGVDAATVRALAANALEIPVSSIPAGTRLVQLGAFDSPEVARGQWEKISGRFDEYFQGKRRVVQQAESGGKTFWRLRAEGFADLSDARRFCTALLAGQADCIPVVIK